MTDGITPDEFGVESQSVAREQATPWTRFWSRTFDVNLWSLPIAFIVVYVFPAFANSDAFSGSGGSILFGLCLLPAIMLVDAACLAVFGNTPGRSLAGIRVETIRHEKLDFSQSVHRSGLVYLKGMGLGIPLVALATYSHNFSRVKNGGQTSWDENLFTRVYDIGNNIARTTIVAVIALAAVIGGRVITQMQERQTYHASTSAGSSVDPSTPSADPVSVQLAKVAATIKPQTIDDITHLNGASVEARVFTYEYSIIRRDFPDSALETYFRTSILPKMCDNPDIRNDLKGYEVTYRYRYSMPNADQPLVYDIKWGDCQALGH